MGEIKKYRHTTGVSSEQRLTELNKQLDGYEPLQAGYEPLQNATSVSRGLPAIAIVHHSQMQSTAILEKVKNGNFDLVIFFSDNYSKLKNYGGRYELGSTRTWQIGTDALIHQARQITEYLASIEVGSWRVEDCAVPDPHVTLALSILCQGYLAAHRFAGTTRNGDYEKALDVMGWDEIKDQKVLERLAGKVSEVQRTEWWRDVLKKEKAEVRKILAAEIQTDALDPERKLSKLVDAIYGESPVMDHNLVAGAFLKIVKALR